jgi:hypothetical protein
MVTDPTQRTEVPAVTQRFDHVIKATRGGVAPMRRDHSYYHAPLKQLALRVSLQRGRVGATQ